MTRRPRKKEHESLKDRLNIRETILICEGPQDEGVLKKVLRAIEKDVLIIPGGGKETVSPLMSAFRASERRDAFSIEDRDFRDTDSEGHGLLSPTDVKNRWLRHDIEAYLLYPDWLVEAVRLLKTRVITEDQAQEAVLEICRELAIFHAGQKTLASLPRWHQASLGAEDQWDEADWREVLGNLFTDTRRAAQDYDERLHLWDWQAKFEGYLQDYQRAAERLPEALKLFSGKRIINKLSGRGWGSKADLPLALAEQAGSYAAQVGVEKLRDDERLGDFGRLAYKLLGRPG
jgi:hypothetical protein